MQKVLILGAGKIGALISGFLAECRDYEVHVADVNGNAANSVVAAHGLPNLHAYELDASNPALLEAHLREHPRFPGPHEDPRRSRRDQCPSRQGSQASRCLTHQRAVSCGSAPCPARPACSSPATSPRCALLPGA